MEEYLEERWICYFMGSELWLVGSVKHICRYLCFEVHPPAREHFPLSVLGMQRHTHVIIECISCGVEKEFVAVAACFAIILGKQDSSQFWGIK